MPPNAAKRGPKLVNLPVTPTCSLQPRTSDMLPCTTGFLNKFFLTWNYIGWSLLKFGAYLHTLQCFNTCAALGTWKHDLLLAGSNDSGNMNPVSNKQSWWTIQLHSYTSRNATACTTSCSNAETYQNQENWFLILSASIWKLWHSSGRNSYTRFPLSSVTPRNLATWNFRAW